MILITLYTSCCGKTCNLVDRCEECHDRSDDCHQRVCEYMAKLSLQWGKKHERKASSSSDFSPVMPVPLYQLPSPAGSGVVMTTPSSLVCAMMFLVSVLVVSTAPFVALVDVTPVELDRK